MLIANPARRAGFAPFQALALVVWAADFALVASWRWEAFDPWHVLPELAMVTGACGLAAAIGRGSWRVGIAVLVTLGIALGALARFGWFGWPPLRYLIAGIVLLVVLVRISESTFVAMVPTILLLHQIAMTVRDRDQLRTLASRVIIGLIAAAILTWLAPRAFERLHVRPRLMAGLAALGIVIGGFALLRLPAHVYSKSWSEPGPPARASDKPNVVLIVLDTLRYDRLGTYGHQTRPATPFLDAFARKHGFVHTAYAPSSWTIPSVATLFTGRSPAIHGVISHESVIPRRMPTLAERFRAAGYDTIGVTANPILEKVNGFSRGFRTYTTVWQLTNDVQPALLGDLIIVLTHDNRGRALVPGWHWKVRTPEVGRIALRALEDGSRVPRFVYLQVVEPHAPCDAPEPVFVASAADERFDPAWSVAYDDELHAMDQALGSFVAEVDRRLDARRTMIVIVADHGEQLGEDGARGHGLNLSEATMRVPLLIRFPEGRQRPLPERMEMSGVSDLIGAAADSAAPAPAAADVVRATVLVPSGVNRFFRSAQTKEMKLVQMWQSSPPKLLSEKLHRLPDESRDVIAEAPDVAATLRAQLEPLPAPVTGGLSDELKARFRALGYLQ